MYALSRGPSKIAASTRRGPPKPIESLENRENTGLRAPGEPAMSSPKPTFKNGRRANSNRSNNSSQEPLSPQHEDIVQYLHENWSKVNHEFEMSKRNDKETGPSWYREKNTNPNLADFKPIDWQSYLANRCYQKITESS
ncbi:mapk-regulated corepressor-interacting protein 1-like [Gigantopelta aegis]|uniref:mapk-regulated corepressor-interacting protein 1-like n=1 Tax=Gigantopelta aegis TaxID=1735272 RepID=UPI001B889DC8|nr:mapk-regulated corepressor-interacting protein 1-like [Gigantopelta aegis]